jgi:SAM-dependent methyltransferase
MSDKKCPLCSEESAVSAPGRSKELQLPEPFDVKWCLTCKHWFLAPAPSEEYLAQFYEKAEGYSAETFKNRYTSIFSLQFDDLLTKIKSFGIESTNRLLDFGCADGNFLAHAQSRGWSVLGYEPTPDLAKAAQDKGLEIVVDREFADSSIEDNSIDVVHSAHVLEHLREPLSALEWFHRILRPGGILSIQVPNQFRDALWPLLHKRWITKDKALGYHVHHLQFFTPHSLEQSVRRFGFEVIDTSTAFAQRNRRTVTSGRRRSLRAAKLALYTVAGQLGYGPHIELFARKN